MSKIETLVKDNEHLYPRTVEKAIYDDNGVRLDNKINQLKTDVDSKCNADLVSDAYSSSKTYYNGDLVIYNNELWKYDKVGASGTTSAPGDSLASRTSVGNEIGGLIKISIVYLAANEYGQFLIPKSIYHKVIYGDLFTTEGYFKTQTSENAENYIIRYKNLNGSFISGSHNVRIAYMD